MKTHGLEIILSEVINRHEALEKVWDDAIKVFGTHDNSLHAQTWALFDAYVDTIGRQCGDRFRWINWFIYDNDCGRRGLTAKPSSWKRPRKIKNVADLAKLISAQ